MLRFRQAARTFDWDVMQTVAVLDRRSGFFMPGQEAEAMKQIGGYISACEDEATKCEPAHAKERATLARKRAPQATKNGGGGGHRFTRLATGWTETLAPRGPRRVGKLGFQ